MTYTIEKFNGAVDKVTALCVKAIADKDVLMGMDPMAFEALQACFELIDASKNLTVSLMEMIEETNENVRLLVERK